MDYVKFEEALELKGRAFEDVEVPELGGKLKLASLPAGKALEFKDLATRPDKANDKTERRQMIILLTGGVVNPDNSPFFADDKAAGKFIDRVSFVTLQAIIKKITSMMKTGSGDDDKDGEPQNP